MTKLIDKVFTGFSIKTIIYLGLTSMAVSVLAISSLLLYVSNNMHKTKDTIDNIIDIEEQTKNILKKLNKISNVEMKIVLAKKLDEIELIDEIKFDDFSLLEKNYSGSNEKLKEYNETLKKMKVLLSKHLEIKSEMSEISYSIISYENELKDTLSLIENEIKDISNYTELISGKVLLDNKRRNRNLSKQLTTDEIDKKELYPKIIEALIGGSDKVSRNVNELRKSVSNLIVLAREISLSSSKDSLNDIKANKLLQSRRLLEKKLSILINTLEKEELKKIVLKMTSNTIRIRELQDFLINLKQFTFYQKENFDQLMIDRKEINSQIISSVNILSTIVKEINSQIVNSFEMTRSNTKTSIITIMLVVAFFLFSFGWTLLSRVNKPLSKITNTIKHISEEDKSLSEDIDVGFNDEFKSLADAFNKMTTSLEKNINKLRKRDKEISLLNKNLEKRVELRTIELSKKTQKISDLFDNAKQGFLSFDDELIIDDEYSVVCEKLLGKDISGRKVSDLLYTKVAHKKEFFEQTIKDVFEEENEIVQESFIELLPKELILNRRALSIEYKKLNDEKMMIILTNITSQKKLEKRIENEQKLLKMIVTIISDSSQFYELINDYKEFDEFKLRIFELNNNPIFNLNETYREIHTFKGMFGQLFMSKTVKNLHEFETQITEYLKDETFTNEDLKEVLVEVDFLSFLNDDLEVIKSILGESFIEEESIIKIDEEKIIKLEGKIKEYCKLNSEHAYDFEDILFETQKLRSRTLYQSLKLYPRLCIDLADKLGKQINPFEILGNRNIILPPNFKAFIKSLIHVFRNLIDHGIEDVNTRIDLEKDEKGTINCNFKVDEDTLIIEISDDGKGIDREKIKQKVLEEGLMSEDMFDNMNDDRVFGLIFYESFSTKEKISEVSGRGIGMSVVKNELVKIKGMVEVKSVVNEGTTFIFKLPYKRKGVRNV